MILKIPQLLVTPHLRRGNSKYHYYGIRIKSDSVLNQYGEEFMLPGRTKK